MRLMAHLLSLSLLEGIMLYSIVYMKTDKKTKMADLANRRFPVISNSDPVYYRLSWSFSICGKSSQSK